jgi:hypothetical protein
MVFLLTRLKNNYRVTGEARVERASESERTKIKKDKRGGSAFDRKKRCVRRRSSRVRANQGERERKGARARQTEGRGPQLDPLFEGVRRA